ncbi:MAG TPA: NAD(P)H-dependent glycerol-3-phosphate dehydrogenase [Vicinamibacterales bacterium]
MKRTAVLGAGSWGSALAVHLARAGHEVRLWARDAAFVQELRSSRENARYLPGVPMPDAIAATDSLQEAVRDARFVVLAVPSHGLRAVARRLEPHLARGTILVSATKGLEVDTLQRMSEVIGEETKGCCTTVVLSGPSFAAEVALGLPAAVLAASTTSDSAAAVQEHFRGRGLRLYVNDDVVGVEIGGAMKNVIAIAAGCVEGLGLGHNALAALITRGLAEITRLAIAVGGRRETLAGLSGLGDLVLTCTGDLSRNRRVGIELGRGRQIDEILSGMRMVAEGVRTTRAALALGARHGIELPIAAQMQEVLDGRTPPLRAVETLMLRRQRAEVDG